MSRTPESVAEFLRGRRVAVAGVSRGPNSAANVVFLKLQERGYEVFPVNPNARDRGSALLSRPPASPARATAS